MKEYAVVFLFLVMMVGLTEASTRVLNNGSDVRSEIPLNDNWRFSKGDFAGASKVDFDDSRWGEVCLPHTWNNLDGQDGGNDYYRGPAWYRKSLSVPAGFTGRRIFVRFGAAGMVADVYVNGNFVGEHKGGFASFVFDVTRFVVNGGRNLLAVKVDNTSPDASERFRIPPISADFTMDGGLYRTAELVVTNKVHISLTDCSSPGVYISSRKITNGSAQLSVRTSLANDTKVSRSVSVKVSIYEADGKLAKETTEKASVSANGSHDVVQTLELKNPHLWNGRIDPYLYNVVVSIVEGGKILDEIAQPLGLRYYRVDPEQGFFLNGSPYKLHGVALHEDQKDKGRAITNADRACEMRYILDIGATMVRFAHYQYDQEMYRLCDENGIVVWTEIPIVNQIDSSEAFKENAEQQLRELIRQNYNHPSVFFWGIFNEIHNAKGPDPLELLRTLDSIARSEDSTRSTTAASNDERTTNFVTEVLGLNQYFGWYYGKAQDLGNYLDKFHLDHPDRPIGLSEYGAGGSIYQHEEDPQQPRPDGRWHPEEYQTSLHEVSWKAIESRPFLWFSTVWNMFDFASDSRGEGFQPGVNDKGIITQDHESPKDSYYWYKVNWNTSPMVHINRKMFAMRDTDTIAVEVYSNAEEVELLVNGNSAGKVLSADHRFFWDHVGLVNGTNYVRAAAAIDGKEYSDECWWQCKK